MLDLFFYFMIMTFGYMLGKHKARIILEEKLWKIMIWDNTIFGYRIVPPGTKVYRGDKLIIAMEFDKTAIPDGGLEVVSKDY